MNCTSFKSFFFSYPHSGAKGQIPEKLTLAQTFDRTSMRASFLLLE